MQLTGTVALRARSSAVVKVKGVVVHAGAGSCTWREAGVVSISGACTGSWRRVAAAHRVATSAACVDQARLGAQRWVTYRSALCRCADRARQLAATGAPGAVMLRF